MAQQTVAATATRSRSGTRIAVGVVALLALGAGGFALLNALNPGLFNLDRLTGQGEQTIEVTFDHETFPTADSSLRLNEGEVTLVTNSSPDSPSAAYTAARTGDPVVVNEVAFCDADAQPDRLAVFWNNGDVTNIREQGDVVEIEVPFGEDVVPFDDYSEDIVDARRFEVVVYDPDGNKITSPYAYRGRSTHPNAALLYQSLSEDSAGQFMVQPVGPSIGQDLQLHFSACGLTAEIPVQIGFDSVIHGQWPDVDVEYAYDTHNQSGYLDTRFLTGGLSSVTITDYPDNRVISGLEANLVIPESMINEDDALYGTVEFCASHNAGGSWQCQTLGEEDRDARNRDRFAVDVSFRTDDASADNRLMVGLRLTQDDNLSRLDVQAPALEGNLGGFGEFVRGNTRENVTELNTAELQFVKAQTTAATAGTYADVFDTQATLLAVAAPEQTETVTAIQDNFASSVESLKTIEGVYGGYAEGYITETKLPTADVSKNLTELSLVQDVAPEYVASYGELVQSSENLTSELKSLQKLTIDTSEELFSTSDVTSSALKDLEVSSSITALSLEKASNLAQTTTGVSDTTNSKDVLVEDTLKDATVLFGAVTQNTGNVLESLTVASAITSVDTTTNAAIDSALQNTMDSLNVVEQQAGELRAYFPADGYRIVDTQESADVEITPASDPAASLGVLPSDELNAQLSKSIGLVGTTAQEPSLVSTTTSVDEVLKTISASATENAGVNFNTNTEVNVIRQLGGNEVPSAAIDEGLAGADGRLYGFLADVRQGTVDPLGDGFLLATLTDLNPGSAPAEVAFYEAGAAPFGDQLTLADWTWTIDGSAHLAEPTIHVSGDDPYTAIMRFLGANDMVLDLAGPATQLRRNHDRPVASMNWIDIAFTTSTGVVAEVQPLRVVALPQERVGVESMTLTVRTQEPAEKPVDPVDPEPQPEPEKLTCHERNLQLGQSPTGPPFVVCGDTCEERNAYREQESDRLSPADRILEDCLGDEPDEPDEPNGEPGTIEEIIDELEEEALTCEEERAQRLEAGEDANDIPLCSPVDIPEHVEDTEDEFLVSYTLEHRDYHRVIVGLEFGAPYEDACQENPDAIAFRWGELGSTLPETATVHYDEKNRGDQKCYAVLRGLKGGLTEGFDTEDGSVKNGRGRYEFAVSLDNNTSKRQEVRTLNRTMSVLYYHCLVYGELCAEVTGHGTLESVKNANLPRSGGVEWWTNPQAFSPNVNPVHPSGIKFAMMTDRRFNEFSDRLFFAGEEGKAAGLGSLSDAKLKEVIAQAYIPVFDRLFDNCIRRADCSSDEGGVNFWFDQMRTIPEVHRIDQDGVIYAMFISEEGQNNYLSLAGGGQDQCEALGSYSYLRGLRRAAESGGARNIANQECGKHGSSQADLDAMIRALAQSDEKENNLREIEQKFSSEADACSGRRAAVTEIYQSCFGRASDTEGVDYWACSQTDIPVLDLNTRFCSEGEN